MKLLLFDYDNTIAQPVSIPSSQTLRKLVKLAEENYIAIISGGRSYGELKKLFIQHIKMKEKDNLRRVFLCTKYGNLIHSWDKRWSVMYKSIQLKPFEVNEIRRITEGIEWGKYGIEKSFGKRIANKGSYISIDCLGRNASRTLKGGWDVKKLIRREIRDDIRAKLDKKYDIYITGRNTIDIVPKGFNKADSILRLCRLLDMDLKNCIFFGDEFTKDGNDYPILSLGIKHYKVGNPENTQTFLNSI
jgi:HAD superfamily hydrolase (TIGR01484 family)